MCSLRRREKKRVNNNSTLYLVRTGVALCFMLVSAWPSKTYR